MSQSHFDKYSELRVQKGFEYVRWLTLIATGAFSIIINLLFLKPENLHSVIILKSALTANAAGILFGSITAYGESMIMKGMVRVLCDIEIYKLQGNLELAHKTQKSYFLPRSMKYIEWLFYLSLIVSVFLFVIFMWMQ